jgi:Tfp pilus assembly protein PilF
MLEFKHVQHRFWLGAGLMVLAFTAWLMLNQRSQPYAYPFNESLESRASTRTAAFAREIAFYQARANSHPDDGLDLQSLASTYLSKARVTGENAWYVLAEQAAERSLAALPVYNSGAKLLVAEVLQAKHEFAGALNIIAKVLESEPRNSSALALRSSIYLALGELTTAERDANTLVKAMPNTSILLLHATILEAQNKLQQAQLEFEQALTLEDANEVFVSARARTLFGRFWMRRGDTRTATALFEEALGIVPKYPQAVLLLAQLEMQQRNWSKAEQLLTTMRESQTPSTYDHAILLGLAKIHTARQQPDAASLWQKAIGVLRLEIQQGAFGHRRELAQALLERGNLNDLAEAYTNAKTELSLRHDSETLRVFAAVKIQCQATKTNCLNWTSP